MLIQILGTGCAKCTKLAAAVEETAQSLGADYTLEKVTDITEIVNMGVMSLPAIVIDGKLRVSGRVPGQEEIRKMLSETS